MPVEHRLMWLAPDVPDERHPRPTMRPHTAACTCGALFSNDSYETARLEWYEHTMLELAGDRLRALHPVKPASGPCAGCGKPILPGSLYLVDGPHHFGCAKAATAA
jgi:hypothetical protein